MVRKDRVGSSPTPGTTGQGTATMRSTAIRRVRSASRGSVAPTGPRNEDRTGWPSCPLSLIPYPAVSFVEAASGFEPENGGFADPCLASWLRRLDFWSGRRDLNPRPSPWQGDALPLSYSRSLSLIILRALMRRKPGVSPRPRGIFAQLGPAPRGCGPFGDRLKKEAPGIPGLRRSHASD